MSLNQMQKVPNSSRGFILLPVVVAITLVAAIAFTLSYQGASETGIASGELERDQLRYVAEAGMAHARFRLGQNTSCSGYTNLPTTVFGGDSYSATISPSNNSPVTITATGTLTSGIERTLIDSSVRTYQPPATEILQLGNTGGKDTLLDSFYDTRNYGGADYLQVTSAADWDQRPVLQFDLASIPANASVISAKLELKHWTTLTPGVMSIHRMSRDWVEGTRNGGGTADGATWPSYDGTNAWTATGGDFDAEPVAAVQVTNTTENLWAAFEIGPLVADWVAGKTPNFGLLMKGDGVLEQANFASREASNPDDAPRLTVTYACECGVGGSSSTLVLQPGLAGKEAYLRGTKNYGATPYTWVDTSVPYHALYEFDLSSLAQGVIVTSAQLDIHQSSADVVSLAADLDVHRVTTAWVEGTGGTSGLTPADGVTWDTSDGTTPWNSAGGDYDSTVIDSTVVNSTTATWHGWDVTNLVQSWVDGTYSNYGFLLRASSGELNKLYLDTVEDNDPAVHPKLTINYSCPCGAVCAVSGGDGSGKNVLLVVGDPASLTSQESAKKSLIESWDYSVNLIDDTGSPTEFVDAFAVNDVVYVSGDVSDASVGPNLLKTSLGVVNEQIALHDELLLSTSAGTNAFDRIVVVDNTHYITDGFPTGWFPITTVDQPLNALEGTLAPGLQKLAEVWISGANYDYGLAVVNIGGDLNGGEIAVGRRVQIPWGATGFDFSKLNDNGRTIMRRAIEWAGEGAVATGPIAHWKLDDGTGTTAIDSEGGHDGTLTNGPVWVAGQLGDALSFDGSNDYIDLTSDAEIDDVFDGGATVMAWINPASWGSNGYGRVFDKSSSPSATGDGWALRLNVDNGGMNFGQGFASGRGWWRFAESSVSLGSWQHIAVAYDASSTANDPIVYLDGSPVAVTRVDAPSGDIRSDASINLHLGNHANSAATFFDGKIDDARIYDRILDAAEIADIAAGGGGGGGGGPAGVVFEEFREAGLSNDTLLSIQKPSSTAAGDLLIAAVTTDGNTVASLDPPAGWNPVNVANGSGEVTLGVWWKLAGASESSSYDFTWSGSEHAYGSIMRFTGHHPSTPIDADSNDVGSSSAPASPSVTTSVTDALILRIGGFDDDDITAGDPGLADHIAINMGDSGNGPATASGGAGYVLQPAAGPSGTSSFSLTGAEQYVTVTIAIAPAP